MIASLKLVQIDGYNADALDLGMKEFLRVNRQLRDLCMNRVPDLEYLQFMSDALPSLETLTIGYSSEIISSYLEMVHFKSVKHLVINLVDQSSGRLPGHLLFERLETLEIVTQSDLTVPRNLLLRNRQLTSISLPLLSGPDVLDILNECDPFRALQHVRFKWMNGEKNANTMRRLLGDFKFSLMKITIIVEEAKGSGLDLTQIEANLQGEWRVSEHYFVGNEQSFDVYHVVISR